MTRQVSAILGGLTLSAIWLNAAPEPVQVRETTVTLPTYLVAPADPYPRFYNGRTYQGAKATFYPYPVSDQMTETREERPYRSIVLENEYVEFSVMPELGGRIFTAVDKGNGYDFFYRQRVIKPALIGMLGAWISGGVEWNVPHHHRASSFMPVDWVIERGADGSATLWVGETELRHRLKWMVGMTLRPGRSYIEMTVKIFNRTPLAHPILFWINPAVHANENYQVLFPPSVQWTVQHGKPEFASWPMARQRYGGEDYKAGVDISWWKNHPSPISFFAWDCREDFFGGYDHGRRAGVVQISDHHVSPGKKFFEWGNGPEGAMWTKILSDEDGPYLELMAGSFSDNQPDYSWLQPAETKVFKHYWYPLRELGGLKMANTEGALNLEASERATRLSLNTTAAHEKARLQVSLAGEVTVDRELSISPTQPFRLELAGIKDAEALRVSLADARGRELLVYQPKEYPSTPMPKPVQRPVPPKEIKTTEELYYWGLRIEQLYSPSYDPEPYYREAIDRDPQDYRANVALGALLCREHRWAEAEERLRAAVERATANYVRAKDCEAHFYLGQALRAQGKLEEAWVEFHKSIWDHAWQAAGYTALAELAATRGEVTRALGLAESAVHSSGLNVKAREIHVALLRRTGRVEEAKAATAELLRLDPLNFRALNEQRLLASRTEAGDAEKRQKEAMRDETASYLELSVDYAHCGFYEDAIQVLELQREPSSAMVPYYLAYFHDRTGAKERARKALSTAARFPAEYCFPYQYEAGAALRYAMTEAPEDALAPYLLGCLIYDHEPERALDLWKRAVGLSPGFAAARRALANGLAQTRKETEAAVELMEKAVELQPGQARWCYELDVLYEAGGASLERRLAMLTERAGVVAERDDAVTRRIVLLTSAGQAGEALRILRERRFHNWEGSSALHGVWVEACLRQALTDLSQGRAGAAEESLRMALEYPENQQVGRPSDVEPDAAVCYLMSIALKSAGKKDASTKWMQQAAESRGGDAVRRFFRGLAQRAQGDSTSAVRTFEELKRNGLQRLRDTGEPADYFAKFGEKRSERVRKAEAHLAAGLGCAGLGEEAAASEHFAQALILDPGQAGARMWAPGTAEAKAVWWPE